MRAIPPALGQSSEELVSGLTCPECFGVLGVRLDGGGAALRFRCRIGHAYSGHEVLVGKEKWIEDYMWAAVTALDELTTYLRDLVAMGLVTGSVEAYERRAALAEHIKQRLEDTLAQNVPLSLPSDVRRDE